MSKEVTIDEHKDIERMHREVHRWVSKIHFTQDEMEFVKKLLNSDVFEPNTPNLFERIREYLVQIQTFEDEIKVFKSDLMHYENELGTFLEPNEADRPELEARQLEMEHRLYGMLGKYGMLKSEIFQYIGGVLKKKSR